MSERPEFVDPTAPSPSDPIAQGQGGSSSQSRPGADGEAAQETSLSPRPGPEADTVPAPRAQAPRSQAAPSQTGQPPAGQSQTSQPFPQASNYRDPVTHQAGQPQAGYAGQPAAPGHGAPSAPQGNYWQPQQAGSAQFQATPGPDAVVPGLPAVPAQPSGGVYYDLGPILIRGDKVITPNGTIPLSQAQFSFQDMSQTTKSTATWAVVLAIVLVWFFLLSLLFLLVQEEHTSGQVIISVTGGAGAYYLTVPVTSHAQVYAWAQQVQQAQMFAAQARS